VTDPEGDATSDQHTTFVCPGKILPVIMFGKLLQSEAVFPLKNAQKSIGNRAEQEKQVTELRVPPDP